MTHSSLQQTSVNTLQQLIDLLLQIAPETYQESLPILSGSSVGKHVRHITEFYLCLFNSLSTGLIDYDARKRNLLLENNCTLAIQTLEEIIYEIQQIQADRILHLKAVYTADETLLVPTTLYRELIYNLEHCIHHLATIRIGVSTGIKQYQIPQTFGVAPSTIQYRQTTCVQ